MSEEEYIETIAYITIFSAFVQMLVPDSHKKEIGFILGLIMLLTVCAPLKRITDSIHIPRAAPVSAVCEDQSPLRQKLILQGMAAELEKQITEKTGVDETKAELDNDGNIKKIVLYGKNADKMRQAAAELCGIDISATEAKDRR